MSVQAKSAAWWEYGVAALAVAACTLISLALRPHWTAANLVMIYLIGVVAVAAKLHKRAAIFASFLSVAAFDFFCVRPYLTFAVADYEYIFTFAVMLGVALFISAMTARIRLQAAEAQAADIRAETEAMRTALLSAVSHDLRTPLASITGAAATLQSHWDRLNDSTRSGLLASVTEEGDRLNRLLGNLLEVTKLESGVCIHKERFPLEEIVGAALHRLNAQIGNRPVVTNIPRTLPMVEMDAVLMEQVFINLVENAVKYTPDGSSIEITASARNGAAEIEVRDYGAGFMPGHEDRVFDKFFRERIDSVRGAGLGLAICRAIVEAHGGSIRAENRPSGAGAIIRFDIPFTDGKAEL